MLFTHRRLPRLGALRTLPAAMLRCSKARANRAFGSDAGGSRGGALRLDKRGADALGRIAGLCSSCARACILTLTQQRKTHTAYCNAVCIKVHSTYNERGFLLLLKASAPPSRALPLLPAHRLAIRPVHTWSY